MEIVLIRHGETDMNLQKIFSTDTAVLTENGRRQIENTRERLKGDPISKVYSSPYIRALQTAEILGWKAAEDKRLREVGYGRLEGLTFDQAYAEYGKAIEAWFKDPVHYRVPDGETIVEAHRRAAEFLEEKIREGEDIMIVSHGTFIQVCLAWALGDLELFQKFKIENGSINQIGIVSGFPVIRKINA